MSKGAFTQQTKVRVFMRDVESCAKCGRGLLFELAQFHHRAARGMGGTSLQAVSYPSNAVALCPACHAWIESHRSIAELQGFLVRKPREPHTVPIKHAHWGWVVLNIDGSVTMHDREEESDG